MFLILYIIVFIMFTEILYCWSRLGGESANGTTKHSIRANTKLSLYHNELEMAAYKAVE